ncbi:MAG: phosphatidate cytidylyltransferase [bacterium]
MSDLPRRLAVALWGIPLLLLALYFGGIFLAGLISLLLLLLSREWKSLGQYAGADVSLASLWTGAAAILFLQFSSADKLSLSLVILALLVLFAAEIFRASASPLRSLGHLALWLLYVVAPISLWWAIRDWGSVANSTGREWLIALFLSVWVADTAAYAFGKIAGRHPLCVKASPNKTWEGAAAGLLLAPLAPAILKGCHLSDFAWLDVAMFAVIVGVFGQAGDLLESLMKREAGLKDTSHFLPGHGGLLDRFDSLLLATPALYLYLLIR